MKVTFGSVCSGIDAASVAFDPLGWECSWFSEIEPFPCAVLSHHYPSVPNYGDMRLLPDLILSGKASAPDVVVAGTPCTAFSVSGLRLGLSDPRGALTMSFINIVDAIDTVRAAQGKKPCVIMWENVPGVYSDKENAFGSFLAGLSGEEEQLQPSGKKWSNAGVVIGPKRGVCWRTLNAQYFGVPQRRRRCFLVASAREGFNGSEILFESPSLSRSSTQSKEAEVKPTGTPSEGTGDNSGEVITYRKLAISEYREDSFVSTIMARDYKSSSDLIIFHPTQSPISSQDGVTHTLSCGSSDGQATVAICDNDLAVRRLTPVECERLQGFPDNYTRVPFMRKAADKCPDSHRYKALGNSWAVPCAAFVGSQIDAYLEKDQTWLVKSGNRLSSFWQKLLGSGISVILPYFGGRLVPEAGR